MSTDLERQVARFAQALDREAPTISYDDVVGRGTVAVDVDLPERPSPDRASRVDGVPSIDSTPSRDEIGERNVLIELAPAVAARRPAWRRVALKVALGVAAVAVLIVAVAAIERDGDDRDPVVDFPSLTTTFVSPRNGFSVKLPEGADVTPATQLWGWSGRNDDGYDVVELGSGAVFRGGSTDLMHRSVGLSVDERADEYLLSEYVLPGACGVPRSQQAEITIDGQSGRIAECSNHIEATMVVRSQVQELPGFTAGRLYLFTLSHDRSDARAVFDAFVATIDLTPHTASDVPADTVESPTYGYSFPSIRGSFEPATERWDPGSPPVDGLDGGGRFDGFETGSGAYFVAASTPIPNGASIDEWVDEYVTARPAGGCGLPHSQQAEITIDGQSGRRAECTNGIEATVVAGGRLYLFMGGGDNRALIDAWIDSIDLTPETVADP
jgi:hypothetical protein